MEYFDVIVIGAGPAGNTAAKNLADSGIDTLVVDWRNIPGDKLCTGIIGLECSKVLPPDPNIIYREAEKTWNLGPSLPRNTSAILAKN